MTRRSIIPLFCLVLLAPTRAAAQADRFEIGQRLRAFETAWDKHKDAAAHKRALDAIQDLVPQFFAGRFGDAARILASAEDALQSAQMPPADVRWAQSLALYLTRRFGDTDLTELHVRLAPFYAVKSALPKDASLRLTLLKKDGKTVLATCDVPVTALPLETALSLKDRHPAEGDHLLQAAILVGGKVRNAIPPQTVSFAQHLSARLAALQKGVAALPARPASTDVLTLRQLTGILTALADGRTLETNYPAARLLNQAEAALRAVQGGTRYYGGDKTGQFWLRLPIGQKGKVARLLAPEAVKRGKPLPLVIALHGAGGSENLFFDGYGHGEIVRLCQQRGWLLVAPYTPGLSFDFPAAALVDEVNRLYPVDRKRVFVVGHSMGATQAARAARDAPTLMGAVAALAGGGAIKVPETLKTVPFFIGVGTRDELMGASARALRDSLRKAKVQTVEYREYAGVEHMMIVQIALPDVFVLFDKAAKR